MFYCYYFCYEKLRKKWKKKTKYVIINLNTASGREEVLICLLYCRYSLLLRVMYSPITLLNGWTASGGSISLGFGCLT